MILSETFGVLLAEIIPMEPETVRTGAGKCLEILTDYCTQLRLFVVGFFCLFQSRLLLLLAERSFFTWKKIESTELRY